MKLPERIQNRLKDFDYSQKGAYFITICTEDRKNILWVKEKMDAYTSNGTLPLSALGLAARTAIENISNHYIAVSVDKYVIMPNHIHMILMIKRENNPDGRLLIAPTVSQIVKQMKAFVTKQIGFPLWQKSFHDHVVRNEQDYLEIWEYIDKNPLKWKDDSYFV